MANDFTSLLEVYESMVRTMFLVDQFIVSRGLQGEVDEFINEKKLELNMNGDDKK